MKLGRNMRVDGLLPALAGAAITLGLSTPLTAVGDEHAFVSEPDSADIEWGPCPAFMPEGCGLAVLQGDPAEPDADVLFRLPADTTAPSHWHTSAERMVLLAGEMEVKYEGQESVTLQVGDYAYGPAEKPHWTTCHSREECVLFIAFEEPVDAMPSEQ